jgi:gliding motility-associated-like protein
MQCVFSLWDSNIPDIATDPSGNLFIASSYATYFNPFIAGQDTLPLASGAPYLLKRNGGARSTITSTLSSCDTPDGTANASVIGGPGPYTYSWMPAGGTDTIATGLAAGTYFFLITNADGCTTTQSVQVGNAPPPVVTVSPGFVIAPGDSVILSATGGMYYSWFPGSGLSCTSCSDPQASPVETTNYCVTVTDTNGCSANACVRVEVTDCPVYIPNAFSPNNDGQNDLECVRSRCVASLHFMIFDRWGTKVFESDEQDICWDGTFKGRELEAAVFTYIAEVTLWSGTEIRKTGTITLVK